MAKERDCPVHGLACHKCGWLSYACSRCHGCYQCEHTALYGFGGWSWMCRDGKKRRVIAEPCGCLSNPPEPPPAWQTAACSR